MKIALIITRINGKKKLYMPVKKVTNKKRKG